MTNCWISIISDGIKNFILLNPFEEPDKTVNELFKKLKSYDELVPIYVHIYSRVEENNKDFLDNCEKIVFSIKKMEKKNEN